MEQLLISAIVVGAVSSLITFLIARKINSANFNIYVEQAKAKAKVIEHEASSLLKDAKSKARRDHDKEFRHIKKSFEDKLGQASKDRLESKNLKLEAKSLRDGFKEQEKEYNQKINKATKILENGSGLTKDEARQLILKQVKEESRAQIASIFRKEYKIAQKNSQDQVNNILSHAVTRFAGEFAAERLTNNIKLKDEESKGKIIGKEGRNIKVLEAITGVDIIIGDIKYYSNK
jgi:ribonuclease Y